MSTKQELINQKQELEQQNEKYKGVIQSVKSAVNNAKSACSLLEQSERCFEECYSGNMSNNNQVHYTKAKQDINHAVSVLNNAVIRECEEKMRSLKIKIDMLETQIRNCVDTEN